MEYGEAWVYWNISFGNWSGEPRCFYYKKHGFVCLFLFSPESLTTIRQWLKYQFEILKYAKNDTEKKPLANATFQLKDVSGNVVKLIKVTDTEYRMANGNETGAVKSFTTVDSGKIVIKGVDLDSYIGSHWLQQVERPCLGYCKRN